MDRLFSLYIKSMGKDTVYRIEERKHPHKPVVDFINDVFNPLEKVEKLVSELIVEQKQFFYAKEKLNSTSTRTTHHLRLSDRHPSELLEKSGVSSNNQNLSEISQKSPYDDATPSYYDDMRHGSSKNDELASDIGQNGTVGVSQVLSGVSQSHPISSDISSEVSELDLYTEVNEQELESRYIEVPNSNSDIDYLLVGHAVMIEPVCHWERVVRTEIHGYLMS